MPAATRCTNVPIVLNGERHHYEDAVIGLAEGIQTATRARIL